MNKIDEILMKYGIKYKKITKEIDSSHENDYRLNIILDDTYVLRINDKKFITEARIAEMERLVVRYNTIGVYAPHFLRTKNGDFSVVLEDKIYYISEYANYPLASDLNLNEQELKKQTLSHLGIMAKRYTNCELIDARSMWSIIDLSPFDKEIDEKQENINAFVSFLREEQEYVLADKIVNFNEKNRAAISNVFRDLPRCVYQGDLNESNVLIKDGRFYGLIDFNLSGTEVNINCFLAETNCEIEVDDFENYSPKDLLAKKINNQDELMKIILSQYSLNSEETMVYENFRNLILISQYPNVCAYQYLLKTKYKYQVIEYLNLILER